MGLADAYTSPGPRDLCKFAFLCSNYRPFGCITRVYEGQFM